MTLPHSRPSWAPFFSSVSLHVFEGVVEHELARRDFRFDLDHGVARIHRPVGGRQHFGLLNLAQLCNQLDPCAWEQVVEAHFDSVLVANEDIAELQQLPFEQLAEQLKLRLLAEPPPPRQDPHGEAHRAALDAMSARIVATGLVATLVMDLPLSVVSIDQVLARKWGVPLGELFARALHNVVRLDPVETEIISVEGSEILLITGASLFTTTHLLRLHELVRDREEGHIVALPNRHTVIVMPVVRGMGTAALQGLAETAWRRYVDGPGSMTPHLYWRTQGAGPSGAGVGHVLAALGTRAAADGRRVRPPLALKVLLAAES